VTLTFQGQGRDPDMFGAHYFENGWTWLQWRIYRKSAPGVSNGHVFHDVT